MRFSIRDLLLWTTIAAIYAALAGALNSRGLLDNQVDFFPAAVVISSFLAYLFYALIRLGRPLVSFRQKRSSWYHAGPVSLIGLFVVLAINNEHSLSLDVGTLIGVVLYHAFAELLTQIALTPNGMGPLFDLYTWEDHRFDMKPNSNYVRITALSESSKVWRHRDITLDIPSEHLEEVRAILEAKQGATEAKTE